MATSRDVMASIAVRIGINSASMSKALNKISSDMNIFKNGMYELGRAITGVFAISRISAFISKSAKLSAEMEGVGAAFRNLNKAGLLKELQESTKGTVSNLELMKAAVKASNFQIPLDQLGTLLEFANKRAQDTGQSVDYLVDSIVMGIGRKSPLILDNLGISAVRLRKEFKGVGVEAATVADVAAAVGKIAQEEMAKAGDIIETSALKTQQLNAALENTEEIIGQRINPVLNHLKEYALQAMSNLSLIFFSSKIIQSDTAKKLDEIAISLRGLTEEAAKAKLNEEFDKVNYAIHEGEKQMREFGSSAGAILKNKYTDQWVKARNEVELNLKTNKALLELLMNFDYKSIPGADPIIPENINNTTEALTRLNSELSLNAQIRKSLAGLAKDVQGPKSTPKDAAAALYTPSSKPAQVKASFTSSSVDDPFRAFNAKREEMVNQTYADYEKMQQMTANFTQSIEYMFEDMAVGFAEAIGQMLASGAKNKWTALLYPIAEAMSALGKMAIAEGIVITGLKKALQSMNGYVAVAAGVALVAVASAIKSNLSNMASNMGSGSVSMPVSSQSSGNDFISRGFGEGNKMTIEVIGFLRNDHISLSSKRGQMQSDRY